MRQVKSVLVITIGLINFTESSKIQIMATLLKYSHYTCCLLLLLFSFSSCLTAQQAEVGSNSYGLMLKTLLSHTVPEIEVATAATAAEETVFLDTRETKEYEVSHIKDARFVGYDNFSMDSVEDIPKDTPIIVYCSVGYRSEKISEKLITAGFTNVANLYGGLFEWKNQGYEVVDSTGETTTAVHAFSRSWGIWLKEGDKVY